MSSCSRLAAFAALAMLVGCITITSDGASWWGGYAHEAAPVTRSLAIAPGAGVTIDAGAGTLAVRGAAGSDVVVTGTSAAASAALLARTRFELSDAGGDVAVRVDAPGNAKVDLVVEVPVGHAVTIRDGSGSLAVSDVTAVDVHDGSGAMTVRRVDGPVTIDDGSGSIDVEDVVGPVTITDGSGSIDVERVGLDVTVLSDGSGSIDVADVGGAFRVLRDGSGGVSHRRVAGEVRIDA